MTSGVWWLLVMNSHENLPDLIASAISLHCGLTAFWGKREAPLLELVQGR